MLVDINTMQSKKTYLNFCFVNFLATYESSNGTCPLWLVTNLSWMVNSLWVGLLFLGFGMVYLEKGCHHP